MHTHSIQLGLNSLLLSHQPNMAKVALNARLISTEIKGIVHHSHDLTYYHWPLYKVPCCYRAPNKVATMRCSHCFKVGGVLLIGAAILQTMLVASSCLSSCDWSPTSTSILLLTSTAALPMFFLSQPVFCNPSIRLCVKIPVSQQPGVIIYNCRVRSSSFMSHGC